jgi:hypothetical protein
MSATDLISLDLKRRELMKELRGIQDRIAETVDKLEPGHYTSAVFPGHVLQVFSKEGTGVRYQLFSAQHENQGTRT